MITESQIRNRLFAYLTREITLNEFEDWLVAQSWNMHRDSDQKARALAGAIELRLAEYTADHLTDDGLDRELKGLFAESQAVRFGDAPPTEPIVNTGTVSESRELVLPVAPAA
jgi:hypothetical protein